MVKIFSWNGNKSSGKQEKKEELKGKGGITERYPGTKLLKQFEHEQTGLSWSLRTTSATEQR